MGEGGARLYCGSFHILGMSARFCARLIALAMRFCFFIWVRVRVRVRARARVRVRDGGVGGSPGGRKG